MKTVIENLLDKYDMSNSAFAKDLREALAEQPVQQEPVSWCSQCGHKCPPAQRKPLTDEQIDAEFDAFASKFDHESNEWLDMGIDAYFRAGFKAAHGIKENT